ncbi:hypothetical protein Q7P37_009982 [Cladosporium fusiforme]
MQEILAKLQIPLRSMFDFVCGTSAGGLIAIGIFVICWDAGESLEKFEELARKTFNGSNGTFGQMQQLVISYLRDCRYSSLAIEESFQSTFEDQKEVSLFNPLTNDTKVAITTTTAKESAACIFSNYNGGVWPKELGYSLIRAKKPENDILISEAASCTSAALWFFKPQLLRNLGTFQDSGLYYNNPLNIATWETKYIWPDKIVDFALSIRTGTTDHDSYAFSVDAYSPVKDRFLSRLYKTFMKSLDRERVWREIYNSLTKREKGRYHRLNLPIQGKEPTLDDVMAIDTLKRQAQSWIGTNQRFLLSLDSMYASMFYFELADYPIYVDNSYCYVGNIYCRVNIPLQGRRRLYEKLDSTASYFLVLGEPTRCVDYIPTCSAVPPFKRKVQFSVETLYDDIGITLLGLTSSPMTISGLPQTATELLQTQQLRSPFGRTDCKGEEKTLPLTPI